MGCVSVHVHIVTLVVVEFTLESTEKRQDVSDLVPRSSIHPVFDPSQYAKMEGENLV